VEEGFNLWMDIEMHGLGCNNMRLLASRDREKLASKKLAKRIGEFSLKR